MGGPLKTKSSYECEDLQSDWRAVSAICCHGSARIRCQQRATFVVEPRLIIIGNLKQFVGDVEVD